MKGSVFGIVYWLQKSPKKFLNRISDKKVYKQVLDDIFKCWNFGKNWLKKLILHFYLRGNSTKIGSRKVMPLDLLPEFPKIKHFFCAAQKIWADNVQMQMFCLTKHSTKG